VSTLFAVSNGVAPLAVFEATELAGEELLELLRGAAARLIQCVCMMCDGDRLLPSRPGLDRAAHVRTARPAGALVADVNLHTSEVVVEP
jgi:hypothetical protein